jgi:surface polysaccharide O-acyltransferase-like enzyme
MWFLFALLYDYIIYALIDRWNLQLKVYKVIPILVILYITMAQGAYLLGISIPNMCYRNFMIEGMCFFLLGNYIHYQQRKIKFNDKLLLAVISVSTLLCPIERIIMGRDFGVNIATFPQVTALFLYGVSNPERFRKNILCNVGTKLSMYIYILHPAVWHTLETVYGKLQISQNIVACYLMPILVLAITMGCAWIVLSCISIIKNKRG